MWTVQAPHSPAPQPNLVPVSLICSRMIQSSGVSASASTLAGLPLIVKATVVMRPPLRSVLVRIWLCFCWSTPPSTGAVSSSAYRTGPAIRKRILETVQDGRIDAPRPESRCVGRCPLPWANTGLLPLDLDDLVGFGAAWRHDLDLHALLLADEGAGEGGSNGNLSLLGVRLRLADDLP